jgi:hypothetical protein
MPTARSASDRYGSRRMDNACLRIMNVTTDSPSRWGTPYSFDFNSARTEAESNCLRKISFTFS